jgi:hypothetical protein
VVDTNDLELRQELSDDISGNVSESINLSVAIDNLGEDNFESSPERKKSKPDARVELSGRRPLKPNETIGNGGALKKRGRKVVNAVMAMQRFKKEASKQVSQSSDDGDVNVS